jgi:hypothetical protein
VKTEIKSSLQDEVKTEIKSSLQDEVKTEIKSSLQDEVRKELYEIEDQRQGALNLIVFNLPECQSRISSERTKYDNAKYMELCKVIGVDEPDLKLAFRLGNPKEGVVRPLKVVMNNEKHRKNILDNASKLKQLPHTSEFVKCIIAKDLTVRQRELNKNRREERKKEIKQRVSKKPGTI